MTPVRCLLGIAFASACQLCGQVKGDGVGIVVSSEDNTFNSKNAVGAQHSDAAAQIKKRLREVLTSYLPYWNFDPQKPVLTLVVRLSTSDLVSRRKVTIQINQASWPPPGQAVMLATPPVRDMPDNAWVDPVVEAVRSILSTDQHLSGIEQALAKVPIAAQAKMVKEGANLRAHVVPFRSVGDEIPHLNQNCFELDGRKEQSGFIDSVTFYCIGEGVNKTANPFTLRTRVYPKCAPPNLASSEYSRDIVINSVTWMRDLTAGGQSRVATY